MSDDGLWDQFMEGDDPDPQKYDEFSDNAVTEATDQIIELFNRDGLAAAKTGCVDCGKERCEECTRLWQT